MATAVPTTVFIVEDSEVIRDHIAELLSTVDGVSLVGNAAAPNEAIAGILRTHPDCVVLDYQLKGGTAVDVLRAIHPQQPAMTFLVLTNHSNPQYRRACLEAGATLFFDKSLEFHKIKAAVAAVSARQP